MFFELNRKVGIVSRHCSKLRPVDIVHDVVGSAFQAAKLNGAQLDLGLNLGGRCIIKKKHPGRVFSRQQLLSDVWGYDYFGGTRTVDVHVRRLRAKLGPEYESVIGTVRNVGYRFVAQAEDSRV